MVSKYIKISIGAIIISVSFGIAFAALEVLPDFTFEEIDTQQKVKTVNHTIQNNTTSKPSLDNSFTWDANNVFAFDMYRELAGQNLEKNVFFSPTSILMAMSMAYEGAGGNTALEMEDALNIISDDKTRKSEINMILDILSKPHQEYTADVANALWIQDNYNVHDDYIKVLTSDYKGTVDTFNSEQSSYDKINKWASDNTQGMISKIIKPPTLDYSLIVLTNAVYFKGDWVMKFDRKFTNPDYFYTTPENKITTKMMTQVDNFKYLKTDKMKIIQMPYKGDRFSMLVILPDDPKTMQSMENDISAENLSAWVNDLAFTKVQLHIPKFKMELEYNLIPPLQNLGINDAFDTSNADFHKIPEPNARGLYISLVKQFAIIDVYEEGTVAVAVTVIGMTGSEPPLQPEAPEKFIADHPFIFAIWDAETNSMLFMGKIVNPSSK